MASYYVDFTGGDDGNPGTIGSPWKTADKASDVCKAGGLNPGDEVLFKRGETWNMAVMDDTLEIEGSSGTIGEANHIRFADYGTGNLPVFDGGNNDITLISHHSGDPAAHYITIENIELTGTYDARMMAVEACYHWTLRNLYLHDNTAPGTGPTAAAISIRRNSRYVEVDNCRVESIAGGEGVYLGHAGDATDRTRQVSVHHCTIKDCDMEGLEMKAATRSCWFYNCTLERNGADGLTQIAAGGRHHVFYQLTIKGTAPGCNSGIYLGRYDPVDSIDSGEECTIERCLFLRQTGNYGAVNLKGKNNRVVNCTMVDCSYGVRCDSNDGGNEVKNCIFDGITDYPVTFDAGIDEDNFDFDNNDYSDGSADVWYYDGAARAFAYVQGTLGQETNGITTAAGFAETGMYSLGVGSGCINTGDSSATVYDWNDEYSATGDVDMGWREYGSWHEEEPGALPHRIFNSFFEDSGAFARFTGSSGVTAGGNVPTPVMGKRVLRLNITDTTARYAYRTGLGYLKHFYAGFQMDADSLTMTSADLFNIFEGRTAGGTAILVIQLYYDGTDKQIRAGVRDDATAWHYTSFFDLTSGWNAIEVFWLCSPDTAYNEGKIILWLNDTEEDYIEGRDNHDDTIDGFYIGAVSGLDAGTTGGLYFDAVQLDWIRRMDSYIGSVEYVYVVV